MTVLRRLSLVLLLAVPAALAGCSSDSDDKVVPPTPPTGTPTVEQVADPCKLVTVAEVTTAIDAKVRDGIAQPGGLPGQRNCSFASTDSQRLATVAVVPGGRPVFDQLRDGFGAAAIDVPGLGEAAVRDAGYLNVLKGDTVLLIFVSGLGSGTQAQTASTALAATALGHL